MIDPDSDTSNKDESKQRYASRAKQRTAEFVREQRYKTLLRGGLKPEQAARMMGTKLRSRDRFRAADILRMIVKGRKSSENKK